MCIGRNALFKWIQDICSNCTCRARAARARTGLNKAGSWSGWLHTGSINKQTDKILNVSNKQSQQQIKKPSATHRIKCNSCRYFQMSERTIVLWHPCLLHPDLKFKESYSLHILAPFVERLFLLIIFKTTVCHWSCESLIGTSYIHSMIGPKVKTGQIYERQNICLTKRLKQRLKKGFTERLIKRLTEMLI